MKLYKFEVIETAKFYVEVEANDADRANERASDLIEESRKFKPVSGVKYTVDNDWSLISAEDIEEEPADEDLVREGEPVVEE